MRQKAGAIPQQSRSAMGACVQKLRDGDGIKDVALVPDVDEEGTAVSAAANGRNRGSPRSAVDGRSSASGVLVADSR